MRVGLLKFTNIEEKLLEIFKVQRLKKEDKLIALKKKAKNITKGLNIKSFTCT